MFSTRFVFVISCLLVAVCYINSLPNDFVFDDAPIVSSNPAIRSIAPIQFLRSPYWTKEQYLGIYRPLVVFSLSIDYALWKRWAPGFRLTNLALHAVNATLVFSLFASVVGPGILPLVAMAIYAVHPIHTEAVTTIVGRSELFSACFLLSAWLLFRRSRPIWASIMFFLALLSKENALVFPAILLLDLLLTSSSGRGRRAAPGEGLKPDATPETLDSASGFALSGSRSAPSGEALSGSRFAPSPRGRGWMRIVPIAIAAIVYLALRLSVLGSFGIPPSARYMAGHLTYVDRLLTAGRVFTKYLPLLVFPLNLAGDYDFNAIPIAKFTDWDAWMGLLAMAAVVSSACYFYIRRNWAVGLGLSFALLAFLPSSNWIVPISVLMAERFLYLPLVGLSFAVAFGFCKIKDKRLRSLIGVGWLGTAIVLCNSHDYIRRNDFTFFKNMVRVVPDSAKARLGYGFALIKAGRNEEAAEQLEAGLRIIPDYPELLAALALAKTTPNSCASAWPLLKRALEIDPNHADTHRRMADCYFKEERFREAEAMYRQALENIPNPDAMLYFMWGRSLERLAQSPQAIAAYDRAALIEPDNLLFRQKLNTLTQQQANQQYR